MHEPHLNGEHVLGEGEEPPLERWLEEASIVLPEQGPLPAFVHHNTLHHFEHLPFNQGVLAGAELLGSEPFQSEAAFARHLATGRIQARDLDAVLEEEVGLEEPTSLDVQVFPFGPTLREFMAFRLRYAFELPKGQALQWCLLEDGGLLRFTSLASPERRAELHRTAAARFVDEKDPDQKLLSALWTTLRAQAPAASLGSPRSFARPRDRLWFERGIDTDEAVHPLLIRFTAAYLDQGLAYWSMPGREHGMLYTFRALYAQNAAPPNAALAGLGETLDLQHAENWDARRTIVWALEHTGVLRNQWYTLIERTLFSLRGWAGMVRQFERHPEWAPVAAYPARLADYLAIQLVLDTVAAKNAMASEPSPFQADTSSVSFPHPVAYEAFVLAQLSNVRATEFLEPTTAKAWVNAVHTFNHVERRRLWHAAYERRYRVTVLDALHTQAPPKAPMNRPKFQAVFCIDDREESLRRHLEERSPEVETLGFAGFFGVAMQYQGLQDVRPRALCPVVVTARHLVREVALDDEQHRAHVRAHATKARTEHAWTIGSRTLVRGGLLTSGLGLAALVPLVGRSLFPGLTGKWLNAQPKAPATRLVVQGTGERDAETGLFLGFTLAEMTDIVANSLRTLAIATRLCPIVLIVGHGSSSLNNPHQAAYDCGATGGGRGGPNARAFAAMANHPEVRKELGQRGIVIPEQTHFVGAYHNTADDSMTYYDEDLVPDTHLTDFSLLKSKLHEACVYDAHERARRFVHVPLEASPRQALERVRARTTDLAQPRPECGHATNALCIVGRRERTRGLFLDRRAFLVSYDPTTDPSAEILGNLLQAVGPVGAGINLEYYFSYVDPKHYGCGSKLPHNVTGLVGIMDGHASDLRTGLPWQMVEIHEPVRLLTIVEATCETLARLLDERPALARLIRNEWIVLVAWDPHSSNMHVFKSGKFEAYEPEALPLGSFPGSLNVYRGTRENVPVAHVAQPSRVTSQAQGGMA